MASRIAGQTSCLSSRWDQPSPSAGVLQGFLGNLSQSIAAPVVSLTSYAASLGPVANLAAAPPPEDDKPNPQGGVEMAVAMAAKINAMLMAKGKLKNPPPLPTKIAPCVTVSSSDDLVVTEVDINDVPINCRNLLTKGKSQEEIRQYSGAVVSTKGFYMTSAEKAQAKGVDRPLYLHIQGKTQEEVNKAVKRIKEIISEDVLRTASATARAGVPPAQLCVQPPVAQAPPQPQAPPLPRPPAPLHLGPTPSQNQRPGPPYYGGHSGNFVHTKVFVGLDQALPSFNVKEKVEGPGGSYLQHIQTETGARVFLRGKGSGYIEQASRRESFEPLYLYISHPNSAGLETAKKLSENLLETVRAEHARMVSVYTATGSTQAFPSQGYPANSSYSSQGSWYHYPPAAYAGSCGYWGNASGAPGHSNPVSTNPPSSQAMVQYPVCPRQPPPYLPQESMASCIPAAESSSPSSPPSEGSPKRRFLEDSDETPRNQQTLGPTTVEKEEPSDLPAVEHEVDEESERLLMPPPPAPLITATRKRQRETENRNSAPAGEGKDPEGPKRAKAQKELSGLVPYGGDSSDEEEDRTQGSKKASL